MTVSFAIGFGIFLVLMAVLVVFVLRFAIREGRRPEDRGDPEPGAADRGRDGFL